MILEILKDFKYIIFKPTALNYYKQYFWINFRTQCFLLGKLVEIDIKLKKQKIEIYLQ